MLEQRSIVHLLPEPDGAEPSGTALGPFSGLPLRSRAGAGLDALRFLGVLRDGRSLCVRELRPDDWEAARTVNLDLSPRSSYLRYFGSFACAGDGEVRRILAPGRDRLSLVAFVDGRPVGLAEVDGLDAPEGCETAMAVDDAFQNIGIGTLLLAEVIRLAACRGAAAVRADVLHDNRVMLRVLQHSGHPLTFSSDRYAQHVMLEVGCTPPASSSGP